MKRLVVLGNGFDLGHNLHTSFEDFIHSSVIYSKLYEQFKGEENDWNNVEERYEKLVVEALREGNEEVNIGEIVDEIIDRYGIDKYGEVGYYDYRSEAFREEVQAIAPLVYSLASFEADFLKYLCSEYNDSALLQKCSPRGALQKVLGSVSRVITFNYTNVAERIYGLSETEHIHGNINGEITIGCDALDRAEQTLILDSYPSGGTTGRPKDILIERMKYYEEDMKGDLVERAPIKRFYDKVQSQTKNNENELVNLLKKKCKKYLPQRKEIIASLAKEVYDEVHIIGHSLGKADRSFFDAIRANEIICYYHNPEDCARKQSAMNENRWRMSLQSDTIVFG